jgi:hypothetical protein
MGVTAASFDLGASRSIPSVQILVGGMRRQFPAFSCIILANSGINFSLLFTVERRIFIANRKRGPRGQASQVL